MTAQILIVDDDPAIRMLLQRIAERAGFEADAAIDGIDALALLRANRYSVLLLDLMMPRMSGYEVLDALAAAEHKPAVVIVSAMATHRPAAPLDSSLVHSIVHKPFDIEMLAQVLTDTVAAIQAHRTDALALTADAEPEQLVC